MPAMVMNQRASAAIRSLAAAMENAGTPADALKGIATVEAREDLASAADLCQQLAVMFNGVDYVVTQAAIRAYYILMDQAGRTLTLCPSCLFSLHRKSLHSDQATVDGDPGLETSSLCRCSCQRGKY